MRITYTEIGVTFFFFSFLLVQRFGMAARDLISWRWAHLAQRQTPVARQRGVLKGVLRVRSMRFLCDPTDRPELFPRTETDLSNMGPG